MQYFWNIIIALIISAAVTAVLTYVLSFKFEKEENFEKTEAMLKETLVVSPIKGKVIPLSEVRDDAFASEALGKGFAIEPTEGKVVAPFSGKVAAIFPTKHAIGLVSDTGVEILIHVGLNTVELNGKYFEALVKVGQDVRKGQPILNFDIQKIKEAGYETQVPIVVTNSPEYSSIETISVGQTDCNEDILAVRV